jgi:hypothetical protein
MSAAEQLSELGKRAEELVKALQQAANQEVRA